MAGYTHVRESYCRDVASILVNCFSWMGSPEGGHFWEAVHDRLIAISRGERPTESCIRGVGDDTARVKVLLATIEERDKEIERQALLIVDLTRKLRIADFVNSSLPR